MNIWKLEHLAYTNAGELSCKPFCAVWPTSPSTCGLWVAVGVRNWEVGSCCSSAPQGQWNSPGEDSRAPSSVKKPSCTCFRAWVFCHWHAFPGFSYLSGFWGNLRVSGSLKAAQRSLVCESDLVPRTLRFLSFLPGFLSPSAANPTLSWKLQTNNSNDREEQSPGTMWSVFNPPKYPMILIPIS